MTRDQNWTKSEGGVIGRFGNPKKALKRCAIALGDRHPNPAQDAFVVSQGEKLSSIDPRFFPDVDRAELGGVETAALGSIAMTLVFREHGMKKFSRLDSWPLDGLPEAVRLSEYAAFNRLSGDRCTLSVGLTVSSPAGGMEVGRSISKKDFVFLSDAAGNQFPHHFVEQSWFEGEGLPKLTAWYVQIIDEIGDKPAAETFVVKINESLAKATAKRGADAIWAGLGAETLCALAIKFAPLSLSIEPVAGSIIDHLSRKFGEAGYGLDQIAGLLEEGETNKVMAISQGIIRAAALMEASV